MYINRREKLKTRMRFRPMTPERACVFIPLLNCVFVWYETALEMCFFRIFFAFSCKLEKRRMYFSSIIAISKTRVCFEAFKPTQENIRMCFCHKHSCLEKTNKVVRNFLSLEQDFLISCYGAAMLAMLVDATSSCPKTMNSSYTWPCMSWQIEAQPCTDFNLQIKKIWSSGQIYWHRVCQAGGNKFICMCNVCR